MRKRGDVNREGVLCVGGKGVKRLGVRKKVVYEKEELNVVEGGVDIEEGLD